MSLDPAAVLALALRCAPAVAPETLLAVARAESGLNPNAIGVNRGAPVTSPPASPAEAAAVARRLIGAGGNLDLGLTQINSANLARLGLSIDDAFEPCRNLAAGAQILAEDYGVAHVPAVDPQAALRTALSLYNTGDVSRGFRNGYVARVVAAASGAGGPRTSSRPSTPTPPAWDAFGDLGPAAFVTTPATTSGAAP
ncbi:lytic transglycosylase domain-containing protein [Phenylobacterium sp.]|uniref:lytic transglycosylase domain-containing protein n=1 Tax=Phenylobacterium sp. TaxID=1871053 RepID=UPI001222C492|nr:lytic transglycosylase domain-containing protein [Phenylobacterium sp.]THD60595.1 MAG: conjugal transfer protein [Phenylobacterium sp.]